MTIRDVLLVLDAYPDPPPRTVVERMVGAAALFDAKVSAVAASVSFRAPGSFLADILLDVPAMAAAESSRSRAQAEAALETFREIAGARGLLGEAILAHKPSLGVHDVYVRRARLRDLTVVSLPAGALPARSAVEALTFGSGRPVLALPPAPEASGDPRFATVAVAWDQGAQAARALGDAMPFLARAEKVHVVTVRNEKALADDPVEAVARHLGVHQVAAATHEIDADGRSIGDALSDFVRDQGVDLLVMGAFGHARLRDFVLGGATQASLDRPPTAMLLSH